MKQKTKQSQLYTILLVAGIIIALNILSDSFFFRLDFTADDRYTLSETTKDLLGSLNEPVTITAYFSEDLPPDIGKTKRDFKELLVEYYNLAGGNLVYEFINPNNDEKIEQEANQKGISPVIVNVREKNQVKQQKAYLGAVIQMGERSDIIPFMQPGSAMEYALSSSIKKLSVIAKPTIGLVQGHGEPSVRAFQQVATSLSVLYNFVDLPLSDTGAIPETYKTIAIVAPTDSFPPIHIARIDEYLARGGKVFLALNQVTADLQTAQGTALSTGLEQWLAYKGINIESDFLADANCGNVSVQQRQGFFSYQSQISFPFLPNITKFADHPITKGLESVLLQFASSISFSGDTSKIKYIPLLSTSEKTATYSAPTYFDIQKQWTPTDFPLANLTAGALFTGQLSGPTASSLVLISDGDFAVNGEGRGGQQKAPDNISLMVNAIDWLSDDTGLIDLRTKGVTSRPLDQLEDGTKSMLKYLNFLLPILLVIIYGVVRAQMRRVKRLKRMGESYV